MPLPLGISECLLGHAVRYDGTDAGAEFPFAQLDGLFDYQGVCPEVGIGMSVPRAPIALFDTQGQAVLSVRPLADPTQDLAPALRRFADTTAYRHPAMCGYVFMKNSPSCGLHTVKVYATPTKGRQGNAELRLMHRQGRGEFAQRLTHQLPLLPVAENAELFDTRMQQNFVTRVFAYARWQQLNKQALTTTALLGFHEQHKYLLLAHSFPHYQRAGRLLGSLDSVTPGLAKQYVQMLLAGLSKPVTRAGHGNALLHFARYIKGVASASEQKQCQDAIQTYLAGEAELVDSIALLRRSLEHYAEVKPVGYALSQVYFAPYPVVPGMGDRL